MNGLAGPPAVLRQLMLSNPTAIAFRRPRPVRSALADRLDGGVQGSRPGLERTGFNFSER